MSKQFFYCLLYSQVEQKDWNNAETSLFDYEEGTIGSYSEELVTEPENMPEIMLNSRIEHLIAKVNEACDRKDAAATHYCDAVAMDRHAISSLRAMSEKRLLTSNETEEFLERLAESSSNSQEKSKENMEMMNVFKQEFDQNGSQLMEEIDDHLLSKSSIDYYIYMIKTKLNNYMIHDSILLAETMGQIDPNNSYLLQVYIGCLAETNNSIELYKIAHRLIETNCEDWLGWYCAGIYYLTIRNFPKSAELLEKSLTKRPTSGLAYMALGHAFSHEREHDQAFNAYLMAEKEMRGSALPHLYVGLEYGSTGNHEQEETFLKHAIQIEPDDPLILQELGVNAFYLKNFDEALSYFFKAIQIIRRNESYDTSRKSSAEISQKWAPLLHNIGSAYRKLGNYTEAIEVHKRAMSISPPSVEGHNLLGFSLALNSNYSDAADEFQAAKSFDRHNQFAEEMLKHVMSEIAKQPIFPFSDDSDDSDAEDYEIETETKVPKNPIIHSEAVPIPSACSNINLLTPTNDEIMSSTPNLGGGAVGPVRPRRPDTRLIGAAKRFPKMQLDSTLEMSLEESTDTLPYTGLDQIADQSDIPDSELREDKSNTEGSGTKSQDDMSIDSTEDDEV